jgi:transposase
LDIPVTELSERDIHEPVSQCLAVDNPIALADLAQFQVPRVFPQQWMEEIFRLLPEHREIHIQRTSQCLGARLYKGNIELALPHRSLPPLALGVVLGGGAIKKTDRLRECGRLRGGEQKPIGVRADQEVEHLDRVLVFHLTQSAHKAVALTDRRVLNKLQCVPGSATADQTALALHQRYVKTLELRGDLLDALLHDTEAQRAKLQDENHALRETVEHLRYKLQCAHYELRKALGVKAATDESEPEELAGEAGGEEDLQPETDGPRKRGAPKGHRGRTRPIPEKVDFTEIIPPPEHCDCRCGAIEPVDAYDSCYVEDIPPVSRIVTERKYQRGRCSGCGKELRHDAALRGPPVVIGPNLAVHLTLMNQMGTTFRKLSAFSTRVLGVELSPSGTLGLVNRVGKTLTGSYKNLGEALQKQAVLNGDETGWKVMGVAGYIWCFCNKHMAFFHPDQSRAAAVIEKILGKDFEGIVMCDFYAAYNCVDKTQRCLVHLLRDIKKEREVLRNSKQLERFESKVKAFIEAGLQVQAMANGSQKDKAIRKVQKQLDRLTTMPVTKGKGTTLQKRIEKYRDDLIRFVTHPDVEFHNNRAERQLRPLVIGRKISFGSNTKDGALRHCIIHSIVETCKLQNRDPIDFMKRAYTSGGLDVPDICSPPAA